MFGGKTAAAKRPKWKRIWTAQIEAILKEYNDDSAKYRRMESAGEYQRALALKALFPEAVDVEGLASEAGNGSLYEDLSLLLNAPPDLLNLAAEFKQYKSLNDPPLVRPNYLDALDTQLAGVSAPKESALAATLFFSLLFRIDKLGTWPGLIERHIETFEGVLQQELDQVAASRALRGIPPDGDRIGTAEQRAESAHLIGIGLSGGGIRSATFCLGVLQALAQIRVLTWFDYLSTVSGGGYIGAWLASWIHRTGFPAVVAQLAPDDADRPSKESQEPIHFLRRYSNYLTPEVGLFSADTWTLVAIWVRNVILNLGILIPGFFVLLLFPRALSLVFMATSSTGVWGWVTTFVLFLWSTMWIGINLRQFSCSPSLTSRKPGRFRTFLESLSQKHPNTQGEIQTLIVIPQVLSVWCAAAYSMSLSAPPRPIDDFGAALTTGIATYLILVFVAWRGGCSRPVQFLLPAVVVMPVWAAVSLIPNLALFLDTHSYWQIAIVTLIMAIGLGVLGAMAGYQKCYVAGKGVLTATTPWTKLSAAYLWLFGICAFCGLCGGAMHLVNRAIIGDWMSEGPEYSFAVMTWGPPVIGLTTSTMVVLFLGLTGRDFPDDRREWWSRLGAWLAIYALGWAAWMLFSLYGPFVFGWGLYHFHPALSGTITASWVSITAAGLLLAKSKSTSSRDAAKSGSKLELLVQVAPYVFMAGLLLAVSYGAHRLITWEACLPIDPLNTPEACSVSFAAQTADYDHYWALVHLTTAQWHWLFADLLIASAIVLLLAARVDINEFSMHHFYRNRLIRCYLGASGGKTRKANRFTGLDFRDDIPMARLRPREHKYQGPYPIVNTAINLSRPDDLAFQERKASSFAITPLYSGFAPGKTDLSPEESRNADGDEGQPGYRATERFAYQTTGQHLGTAMAISGAAASPNWGYHTSAVMAFLMTIFNVRLGWWLGNPLKSKWRRSGPQFNLGYLLCELVGLTSASRDYVYLSDGGHFDNMGLYELVRRRCRYIVIVDGEEDAEFSFEGLGIAIRKCRIDFAVDIDLNLDRIRNRVNGYSESHCAIGNVWYPPLETDKDKPAEERRGKLMGTIVYIKSSLTGDEDSDVIEYAAKNNLFPHQSTGDQFFDESQFESYRKLGLHAGFATFDRTEQKNNTLNDRFDYVIALRQKWYAPSSAIAKSFTTRAADLDRLWERLRTDKSLDFLSQRLYPDWGRLAGHVTQSGKGTDWFPSNTQQLRNGFYLCVELIQLMENVYVDLNLEKESDHPDNRGWMNLFRQWSHVSFFRLTWTSVVSTYGARFQTFCRKKLQLELGKVQVFQRVVLNEVERTIIRRFPLPVDPGEIELYRLTLSVDLHEETVPDPAKLLPFGFALVADKGLLAYRVQDHLRQMGLGRKGLVKLAEYREGSALVMRDKLVLPEKLLEVIHDPSLPDQIKWTKRALGLAIARAKS